MYGETLASKTTRARCAVGQCDVNSAFLQPELSPDGVVFIRLPESMRYLHKYSGCVLRLHKALYGLKQSARAWKSLVHKDLSRSATVARAPTSASTSGKRSQLERYRRRPVCEAELGHELEISAAWGPTSFQQVGKRHRQYPHFPSWSFSLSTLTPLLLDRKSVV